MSPEEYAEMIEKYGRNFNWWESETIGYATPINCRCTIVPVIIEQPKDTAALNELAFMIYEVEHGRSE